MILVSTMGFSGTPDIVVWPENTLDIALWVKFKMAAIYSRSNNINMSIKWYVHKILYEITLWVKSKMAVIGSRSNNKLI